MSVKITINGMPVEAPEGALLIDVCRDNGIDIPHFCYHPGLGPDGNCRMCQVEFVSERGGRLAVSCKAVVAEGMQVLTHSESAKRARASVEEMLLLNHPLDCPICDKAGECTLQNYYMEHDLQPSRQNFTRVKKGKAIDLGPTMVLDQERCVLCDRCVRFLRDVAGDEQLYIAGRGHDAFISAFPGQEVTSAYSLNTVDLCPVGALTSKDFRFATPTWYIRNTDSVCTTCARGCNMQIQVMEERIVRMRPRHNPEVNGYWACDEGRLDYKFVNEGRVEQPLVRREGRALEASFEEALAEWRRILGYAPAGRAEGPAPVEAAMIASAHATLEELYLLKKLAARTGASFHVARHLQDGEDDRLLRRADRHPNARGAELLGLPVIDLRGEHAPEVSSLASAVRVLVGFHRRVSPAATALAANAAKLIVIDACQSALTERADLVIPGLTFAEKDGLVVNFGGRVQRLKSAVRGRRESEWRLIDALLASLDAGARAASVAQVRAEIVEQVPAFSGASLADVGRHGVQLAGAAVS
ncbi:MAG: 2Fe-2S iron-sulfur cluster-binding protein [Candidatus Krumholzibacteria bacterium]|nr:2Fe-2S iron-sulfur cluster-binding protein [Candidatus Krumholzibacteria bacterium]